MLVPDPPLLTMQCKHNISNISILYFIISTIYIYVKSPRYYVTPCLVSPQPQVSCPRAGPPPPSLIHMVELGFVGLLNNPKRIFAQLQKLEVKLAST